MKKLLKPLGVKEAHLKAALARLSLKERAIDFFSVARDTERHRAKDHIHGKKRDVARYRSRHCMRNVVRVRHLLFSLLSNFTFAVVGCHSLRLVFGFAGGKR